MINHEELKERYNPEGSELRNLQYKMVDELVFLDKICRENNLKYFLVGGSVLGAVRHKGFIPWDDDADIALLEDDYKKLISILLKLDDEKYVLQCQETDFNYITGFPKFREREGTLLGSFPPRGALYKYKGIGVDIFCYSNDSYLTNASSTFLRGRLLGKMYKIKNDRARYILTKIMYSIYKGIVPLTKVFNLFSKKGELHFSLGQGFRKYKANKEDIFPVSYVPFENLMLPIPHNYDRYLTTLYGNWRELPKTIEIHSSNLLPK